MKIEWVIVKGVSQFANDLDPPNNLWKSFACTMAASLVFNMLNDPLIFKNWPHFDGKCSSAWLTALRCIQLFRDRFSEKLCTRQSRKVIWDMINTLFLTL